MKVKLLAPDRASLMERVKFWCAGCGQFHVVPASVWNQDLDNPTFHNEEKSEGVFEFGPSDRECRLSVRDGMITWGESFHRLSGKELPLQHEEAWKDHNWDKPHEAPAQK